MALFSDPSVGIADPLLARAFALAERGRGTTSPNPLVGCVVARDGRVVGEGFHERAGGPHAEVVALDAAGEAARGADAYVTLEPCTHHGRTPPCVDRLLAEGVASVTIGMSDPNTGVSGGGAAALERAGVRVAWAPDPRPFEDQNEAWLTRLRTGLPFVTVKVALSLDARLSLAEGERSRITGAGGRHVTMLLRARAGAVAVGARTLSIDAPSLTVRDGRDAPSANQPLRVVLARMSVPDPGATLFSDGAGPTLVLISAEAPDGPCAALEARGVCVVRYPAGRGVGAMLHALAAEGCDHVLIEAGPMLFSALWEERAIDELVVVTAGGIAGLGAPGLDTHTSDGGSGGLVPRMRAVESAVVGDDAVTVWRPLVRS